MRWCGKCHSGGPFERPACCLACRRSGWRLTPSSMNASSVLGGDPASWPAGKPTSLVSRLRPAKPLPLTRAERIRRFGVDCGDGLTWAAGWVPGGEYTKQLIVKNVSKVGVRLKYKLPESKFFSMAFPEMIQLNPGLSMTLQVSARRDVEEGFGPPELC